MTAPTHVPNPRRWRGPKWGLAIPSFIWYILFFVAPIGIIILYSFGTKDSSQLIPVDLSNLSLENYRQSITGDNFDVFYGTLKIAVTATLLCLLIGFPVSYFIAFKASEKWRAILLALVVIPSFTSFLIRTIAWRIPLSPNGELSTWLQDLGWIDGPIDILGTRGAVFLAIVYNYVGFMVLPMFVALDRIDPALRCRALAWSRACCSRSSRCAATTSRPPCSVVPRASWWVRSSTVSSAARRTGQRARPWLW